MIFFSFFLEESGILNENIIFADLKQTKKKSILKSIYQISAPPADKKDLKKTYWHLSSRCSFLMSPLLLIYFEQMSYCLDVLCQELNTRDLLAALSCKVWAMLTRLPGPNPTKDLCRMSASCPDYLRIFPAPSKENNHRTT